MNVLTMLTNIRIFCYVYMFITVHYSQDYVTLFTSFQNDENLLKIYMHSKHLMFYQTTSRFH
jgi:hypothetical protein